MTTTKGNTSNRYEPEFKKEIVRLVLDEGRTIRSVNAEYGIGDGTVGSWIKQFREECESNPQAADAAKLYEENRRLRKELAESKKEIDFLKKAAAFFARETV